MKQFFETLKAQLEAGKAAALVMVAESSGSTPRGAGARMLVTEAGRVCGTVGGGAVEYHAQQMALKVMGEGRSRIERLSLKPNELADLGMICGGDVTLCFYCIPAGDADALGLCSRAEAIFATGEASWLICDVTGDGRGGMSLLGEKSGLYGAPVPANVLAALGGAGVLMECDGRRYYGERLTRAGVVYIFGGGHVAQALVPTLSRVDFRCVVLEDRQAFADPALFPGVWRTRLVDMNDLSSITKAITEDDYLCVMTRGHICDYLVERQVLRTPARYIGVIGSARKTEGVQRRLREDGFTEADFARVTTPIGLDILSETPAEIAVSIAAQLIRERAQRERG